MSSDFFVKTRIKRRRRPALLENAISYSMTKCEQLLTYKSRWPEDVGALDLSSKNGFLDGYSVTEESLINIGQSQQLLRRLIAMHLGSLEGRFEFRGESRFYVYDKLLKGWWSKRSEKAMSFDDSKRNLMEINQSNGELRLNRIRTDLNLQTGLKENLTTRHPTLLELSSLISLRLTKIHGRSLNQSDIFKDVAYDRYNEVNEFYSEVWSSLIKGAEYFPKDGRFWSINKGRSMNTAAGLMDYTWAINFGKKKLSLCDEKLPCFVRYFTPGPKELKSL